jgi:flagellar hook protein FlgE
MMRSMFTAIGALQLHQEYMDTVADNLANVNTTGFKSNRFSFESQIAQLMQTGSAPTATLGGVDPTQIGLGVSTGATVTNFAQGSLQATGRPSDIAIQGDGFFIYRDGAQNFYSRDGSVSMDAAGFLVNNSSGMRLQGWQTSGSAAVNTGLPLGDIQIPLNASLARATTAVTLNGNLDATSASGSAGAYTSTMGVYDSLGVLHNVAITFTPQGSGVWNWAATSGSASTAVGSGSVTFDATGQYSTSSGSLTFPGALTGSAAPLTVTPNLSALTQLATGNSVAMSSQDGVAAGNLTGFSVISSTGEIYGTYSNGLQQRIGQLALANFNNPSGLDRVGQNNYAAGLNSGAASVGLANTGGRGTLVSGYVEGSNVDMSQEFTNMILAERGFQASSRVITTSDEMLQELVNLKH